jgi:hypothetical protein
MLVNLQTFENILKVIGVYGVVQILALDIGIENKNNKYKDLLKSTYLQLIFLYAGAYTASSDHTISIIAILIYIYLNLITL